MSKYRKKPGYAVHLVLAANQRTYEEWLQRTGYRARKYVLLEREEQLMGIHRAAIHLLEGYEQSPVYESPKFQELINYGKVEVWMETMRGAENEFRT